MTNNSEHSFVIVRFNEKTYISGGVVAVVKGAADAQRTLNDFEWCQAQEDRSSGWRPESIPPRRPSFANCGLICRSPRPEACSKNA
jgi:hypothetical protein